VEAVLSKEPVWWYIQLWNGDKRLCDNVGDSQVRSRREFIGTAIDEAGGRIE
jgi:hypothetical protein